MSAKNLVEKFCSVKLYVEKLLVKLLVRCRTNCSKLFELVAVSYNRFQWPPVQQIGFHF